MGQSVKILKWPEYENSLMTFSPKGGLIEVKWVHRADTQTALHQNFTIIFFKLNFFFIRKKLSDSKTQILTILNFKT